MNIIRAMDGTPGVWVRHSEVPESYWKIHPHAWQGKESQIGPPSLNHAIQFGGATKTSAAPWHCWIPLSFIETKTENEMGEVSP
jgi:hypothetical protein